MKQNRFHRCIAFVTKTALEAFKANFPIEFHPILEELSSFQEFDEAIKTLTNASCCYFDLLEKLIHSDLLKKMPICKLMERHGAVDTFRNRLKDQHIEITEDVENRFTAAITTFNDKPGPNPKKNCSIEKLFNDYEELATPCHCDEHEAALESDNGLEDVEENLTRKLSEL